jgi:vacuolar-type H+-ATPase subunit I/STV1
MRGKLIRRKKRQQSADTKQQTVDTKQQTVDTKQQTADMKDNDKDDNIDDDYGNWENVFTQEKQKSTVNNLTLQIDDIQIHKGRVENSILLKLNDVILTCELADPEKIKLFDEAATGED